GRQTDAQGVPADARHESAGSFGFDARLIRQHDRDVVFDRIDTPASGTFQALAVGREPDGPLTQGTDKDLEQLLAHRHGNLLRANRPTVADANCRKQLPRLTSPLIARVFRPRGSSAKAIYKPRLQRDKLQAPAAKEFSHHLRNVLALAVHGIVQPTHYVFGDLAGESVQRVAHFRMALQRLAAHDGHSLVRRKVVAVVLEHHQVERCDDAVRGISGHNIHRLFFQRAIYQTQVHNP